MRYPANLFARAAIRVDEERVSGAASETDESVEPGEPDLILAAQADIAAFDALYHRYLSRVYRYARAQIPNDEEASDLTQLVFLRALEALPRYQPRGAPFAVWLFRIARNAVIDARRRQRPTVPWQTLTEALHPESGAPLDHALIQQEEMARLRHEVSRLSSERQELLALSFAAGLSAPEIASVLRMKPDAVRKRLSRAIGALKESYHAS